MMPVFYLKQLFPKKKPRREQNKTKKDSAAASPLFLSPFFFNLC